MSANKNPIRATFLSVEFGGKRCVHLRFLSTKGQITITPKPCQDRKVIVTLTSVRELRQLQKVITKAIEKWETRNKIPAKRNPEKFSLFA